MKLKLRNKGQEFDAGYVTLAIERFETCISNVVRKAVSEVIITAMKERASFYWLGSPTKPTKCEFYLNIFGDDPEAQWDIDLADVLNIDIDARDISRSKAYLKLADFLEAQAKRMREKLSEPLPNARPS